MIRVRARKWLFLAVQNRSCAGNRRFARATARDRPHPGFPGHRGDDSQPSPASPGPFRPEPRCSWRREWALSDSIVFPGERIGCWRTPSERFGSRPGAPRTEPPSTRMESWSLEKKSGTNLDKSLPWRAANRVHHLFGRDRRLGREHGRHGSGCCGLVIYSNLRRYSTSEMSITSRIREISRTPRA